MPQDAAKVNLYLQLRTLTSPIFNATTTRPAFANHTPRHAPATLKTPLRVIILALRYQNGITDFLNQTLFIHSASPLFCDLLLGLTHCESLKRRKGLGIEPKRHAHLELPLPLILSIYKKTRQKSTTFFDNQTLNLSIL